MECRQKLGKIAWILAVLCCHQSYANTHQCFADPQVAYAYLLNQNKSTKININTATESTLTNLEGVGIKTAQNIILYRQSFGGFKSVDDLLKVKGIGPKTLDKNRHKLTVQ